MKKIAIFLLFTLIIAGTVFAQQAREQRRELTPHQRNELQRNEGQRTDHRREVNPRTRIMQFDTNLITVSGTLKLQRGMITIESGDSVYFVPLLNRYIGFINGLTEGANVSIEGFPARNFIRPTKLTIDDRTYDFPAQRMNHPQMNQNHRHRIENYGKNHGHGRNFGHHHPQNHRGNRNNQNRSNNCCRR